MAFQDITIYQKDGKSLSKTKEMKILIIINGLGTGGAEKSTEVICDYLEKSEISFEVLCLKKRETGVQNKMIEKGYKINFVPEGNFFTQANFISKWIKKGQYNLVHSILFASNLRTRFARAKVNFVHLESLVNTTYSKERLLDKRVNQKAPKLYKFLDKVTASHFVDHFHSITATVKKHYIEEVGLKDDKITVIPRGRKPIISDYVEKRKLPDTPLRIINVGRHEFQKGQIHLLKAIKELKERGNNIELRIYGRHGVASDEMARYIKEHDLENVVKLEGFKSNVPEYLLKSHLFVFPSLYEGLGGALIEAQAAGLPIACNDIPVLHEVVNKDVNAKFFNVHNLASRVEALTFFIENTKEREAYGKESLKNYQLKFTEKKNNLKMLELYKELC